MEINIPPQQICVNGKGGLIIEGAKCRVSTVYAHKIRCIRCIKAVTKNQITTDATAISSTKMVVSSHTKSIPWIAHEVRSDFYWEELV